MRIRATRITTTEELRQWARDYHKNNHHPCGTIHRYAIGLYQIGQAYDWVGTPSEYESYAAACIHIIAACESLDIPLELYLSMSKVETLPFGKGPLLDHTIYRLQAQIFYGEKAVRQEYKRKGRFDPLSAAILEARVVLELLGRIPPKKRIQAIYEAMEIMTGIL